MSSFSAATRARGRVASFRRPLSFEALESRRLLSASAVPALSSRPGAPATLYLDFDGNVEERWGGRTNVVTPAYDTDGNKASYSDAELAAIREIFARVAEDYSPFNLNVTTVPPPLIADRVAAKVAIGGSYSDWYGAAAGGVSYVGGFAGPAPNVGFVFANTLGSGNPRFVAEAISHEAGHLFGLEHQATWSGGQLVTEYNSGDAALAPIMGVSYYATRSTWSRGATADGPAASQDDLAVIASSANGFGYAADDYGNSLASAAPLPILKSGVNLAGVIGRNDDRDVFKFNAAGGQVSFTLDVAQYGPNLDAVLELQDSAGRTILTANPTDSFGASLSTTLAAGAYYVVIHSSGGYGNLGRYNLRGSVAGSSPTTSSPPPISAIPSSPTTTPPPTSNNSQIADDSAASFAVSGAWQKLAGTGYATGTRWAAANSGAAAAWTFANLPPGQYRVSATWTGSALHASDAPFSVLNGNQLLSTVRVNQQRAASTFSASGASWQNLGTFTVTGNSLVVRLNSTTTGRVIADAIRVERVYSTSGGV